MNKILRRILFSKRPTRFIILATILITYGIIGKGTLPLLKNESPQPRGVIVTLIRSTNQSVSLTINMIHSVLKFHFNNSDYFYPFLIFHDQNFTTMMSQQILSCVLQTNKPIQISFALIDFQTTIKPDVGSRADKPIGYRLMCRFWTYDVFNHPAIVGGQYDYLMRMDDDSYFQDTIQRDLFMYMKSRKLDYIYRSTYSEPSKPMEPILKRFINVTMPLYACIYNNFFLIRLKWFHESKRIQSFIQELLQDDLMLHQYIGDGCVHAAMLKIDNQTKIEHITDISYGHNYHTMVSGQPGWRFHPRDNFYKEISNSCRQLIIIKGSEEFYRCIYITIIINVFIWFIIFQSLSLPTSLTQIDKFLTSTLCGRLIRYPNLTLTNTELTQLNEEASLFFSYPKDCSLFQRRITITSEELSYPLAFTILIHSNLDQFDFLLRTIYRHHNYYCIHVDLKSPSILYQTILDRSKCVTNIHVLEKRFNVTWAQFSVLEAEHACQKELLKQSNQWKYYFNLANTDIPLKTNTELVQILKLYNNQNDITSLPYRSQRRQKNALLNRTFSSSISLPFYKGEFHVLLTRSTVEYIHTNSRVADLYNYLNGTLVPDEHFYPTVNRWETTPDFYPYDHDLSQISFMTRYKIWNDRPEYHLCRGGFVRGICIFNYQDLWHLTTSPHFFGNKIFFERDRLVSYCVAQYLDVRDQMKQEQNDFSMIEEDFYKQLKNVQYGKNK